MKCCCCGTSNAEIAWQPFGPADNCRDDESFMAPGFHYRGFPVLRVCDDCRGQLGNGEWLSFTYKGKQWHVEGETLRSDTITFIMPFEGNLDKS